MKILLLGDLCPKENTDPLFQSGDVDTLFGDTLSIIRESDFTFVNLECALTESEGEIIKHGPCLKGSPATASVMKEISIDLAGLSNNHIFDYGIRGYRDTVEALDRAGIPHTGFGENYEDARKNYRFEKNGERICFICVCEHEYSYALKDRMGSRAFDCYDTLSDIRAAKAESDKVIVIYHGGKENCRYPSPRLRKACHAMVEAGADVIACQHSHCIGCSETYRGGFISYGQGNFHFVSDWSKQYPHWPFGLILRYDTESGRVERIPININAAVNGIELSKGETLQNTLDLMETLDASMKDGSFEEGYAAYCESVREHYAKNLSAAFAPDATPKKQSIFGHFLDCEAHLDMLLCHNKTANHTNEK